MLLPLSSFSPLQFAVAMSNSGESSFNPAGFAGGPSRRGPVGDGDPRVPLRKLSTLCGRMDSVQRFLSESVNRGTLIGKDQMEMVSSEISWAIQEIIVNGTGLLACAQKPISMESTSEAAGKPSNSPGRVSSMNNFLPGKSKKKLKSEDVEDDAITETGNYEIDCDIVELDVVELLAECIHFCEICGKAFKRDANLRMHKRAHGNQFKTLEALAKPPEKVEKSRTRRTDFSCPYKLCNRNKSHKNFKPLKSAICARNHFKRSHCPKMYTCNRCNKKSFYVLADLKSHLKHCREPKWRCSCGVSFSREDKLFAHVALFEGHVPAVMDENERGKGKAASAEVEEEERDWNWLEDGFFDGLPEEFSRFEKYCLENEIGFRNGVDPGLGNS